MNREKAIGEIIADIMNNLYEDNNLGMVRDALTDYWQHSTDSEIKAELAERFREEV